MKIDVINSRIFKDLVEYSGINPKLVLRRCDYAVTELAILWNRKKSVLDYYKDNELYIYDLTKYQLILEHHKLIEEMIKQIKEIKAEKILEFGGGIGEFSIMCHENNLNVTYFDVDGLTRKYALWRFKKYKCSKISIANSNPLKDNWDVVNIMDVFEHLENPEEVISQLKEKADYIFCNPNEIKYGIYFPQHISKFDLTGSFENIKGYLWKNITK